MNRHAVTLLCLLCAVVFYVLGYGFGIELAVVVGFISEMIFWVRVSRRITAPKPEKVAADC